MTDVPPPPTPMTRINAKFSESERSGIGLSSDDPRGADDVVRASALDPVGGRWVGRVRGLGGV